MKISRWRNAWWVSCAVWSALCLGCGATKIRTATEQLLMSDALDRAVSQIDFSAMARQKVYFDTKYIQNTKDPMFIGNAKGLGFVNAEYVISSLRQQMVAAGLLLQDKIEDADYVLEARLGAVGNDNNEVLFGIPATNLLSSAQVVLPNTPPIPAIPEIAIAKRNVLQGAAKIGVFAYHRASRAPVWQSGISKATSSARDTWVLGAGPFQQGTIYDGTYFAGSQLAMPIGADSDPESVPIPPPEVAVSYYNEHVFGPIIGQFPGGPPPVGSSIQPAGFSEPLDSKPVQVPLNPAPSNLPTGSPPTNAPPVNPQSKPAAPARAVPGAAPGSAPVTISP